MHERKASHRGKKLSGEGKKKEKFKKQTVGSRTDGSRSELLPKKVVNKMVLGTGENMGKRSLVIPPQKHGASEYDYITK